MRTVVILFMVWICFREAHPKVVNVHVDVNIGSQEPAEKVGLPQTPVLRTTFNASMLFECPEYDYNFMGANGEDFKVIHDILSWEHCGLLGNLGIVTELSF